MIRYSRRQLLELTAKALCGIGLLSASGCSSDAAASGEPLSPGVRAPTRPSMLEYRSLNAFTGEQFAAAFQATRDQYPKLDVSSDEFAGRLFEHLRRSVGVKSA